MSRGVQRRFKAESASTMSKSDASPVTVADFAVQALVIDALWKPESAFIAEETSDELRNNKELLKDVTSTVNETRYPQQPLTPEQVRAGTCTDFH